LFLFCNALPLIYLAVIPITSHQDTVGPICRSVADAAAVLSVIAGSDSRDNYTSAIPQHVPDYTRALKKNALAGKRIGVPRKFMKPGISKVTHVERAAFERALDDLRALGATIVEDADLPSADEFGHKIDHVILVDFKVSNMMLMVMTMSITGPVLRGS
jgi:amidase